MALHLPFLAGIALGCIGVVAFNNRAKIKDKFEDGFSGSKEYTEEGICKTKEFVKDSYEKTKDVVQDGIKRTKKAVDAFKADEKNVRKTKTTAKKEPTKEPKTSKPRKPKATKPKVQPTTVVAPTNKEA